MFGRRYFGVFRHLAIKSARILCLVGTYILAFSFNPFVSNLDEHVLMALESCGTCGNGWFFHGVSAFESGSLTAFKSYRQKDFGCFIELFLVQSWISRLWVGVRLEKDVHAMTGVVDEVLLPYSCGHVLLESFTA